MLLILQPELQGGEAAEQVLHLRRILHTGQLNVDAVRPLPHHGRLGDAQLIHAIAKGGDVLLDRIILTLADRRRAQCRQQGRAAAGCALSGKADVLQYRVQRLAGGVGLDARRQKDAHRVGAVASAGDDGDILVLDVGRG